eukprot:jgi/Mesvir1/18927/Mv25783-RA.2
MENGAEDMAGINVMPARFEGQKIALNVEVCLKRTSTAKPAAMRHAIERLLEKRELTYGDAAIPIQAGEDPYIDLHVESIAICDTDDSVARETPLDISQVDLAVHVFQLNEEGAAEEMEGEEEIATYREWELPCREFHGMWDALVYEVGLKRRLLRYAECALLFSQRRVNTNIISWNR